jgi:uncharacterized cupin superfamily protein
VTTKALTLLSAAFLVAASASAQDAQRVIRFAPSGPTETGLVGDDGRRSHVYYRSAENRRVSAGVWEADPYTSDAGEARYSEFMYLLDGSVTLIDGAGREETFRAGDAVLVPRGTRYTWKQTEHLRKYWAIFDVAGEKGADATCADPTFIRLEANGPAGAGLTARGRTMSHRYYAGQGGSSVGVWETAPHTGSGFHEKTFQAGDVALVPRGTSYQWKSGTARKFWAIFDGGSSTPCQGRDG